jgi:hypothetical protein
MHKILFLIIPIFLFLFLKISFAQVTAKPEITLQGDITTAIAVFTFGGSADIDLLKINNTAYTGIRLSVERYLINNISFDVGGGGGDPIGGSPFFDTDLLGRFTFTGKKFDFNLCPGITYHKTSNYPNSSKYDGLYAKFACDVKLKLYKNIVGLLLKFGFSREIYGGIGFYLGYSSRDK